jgi:hypothetical protein
MGAIYKRAATPIIPATTPVRPPTARWSAAPVNWAGREEVAEAALEAAREGVDVLDAAPAADEARLEAEATTEEARLDAEAAADDTTEAAEEARLDAEAAADDATEAAEEARDEATLRADEMMGATTEGTAGAEGTAGTEGVLKSNVRAMLSIGGTGRLTVQQQG